MNNIFESIPTEIPNEIFTDLVTGENIRVERILSKGQTSPENGWYDQDENEWVMVLKGEGTITFDDGHNICLQEGDFITIPKHKKHKVSRTDPNHVTVWLAIFYK
ncbi:cupin domain-containing protein [Endozoicomonas sp. Mp262]|uniref:cupin domain-containing protein n=1 Tax=Endozoicomonas sp. Mp262 TaxID=2919499 RepID=UPI0021DAACD3